MTEKHADEHASFIKTPRQLLIVVILAHVIPISLIVMLVTLTTSGTHSKDHPALSEEAVARRIKAVGEVVVDAGAPTVESATAPAAAPAGPKAAVPATAAPAKTADAVKGKAVHGATCVVCHGPGVAGAPKDGDKAAWAPRLKSGVEALYASALKGKNAMPPKGGNPSLSDADVKAAVDYMAGLAR